MPTTVPVATVVVVTGVVVVVVVAIVVGGTVVVVTGTVVVVEVATVVVVVDGTVLSGGAPTATPGRLTALVRASTNNTRLITYKVRPFAILAAIIVDLETEKEHK